MNFTSNEKSDIFKIVAAILHLGNFQISGDENNSTLEEK
jgi:myosin heavy subunit